MSCSALAGMRANARALMQPSAGLFAGCAARCRCHSCPGCCLLLHCRAAPAYLPPVVRSPTCRTLAKLPPLAALAALACSTALQGNSMWENVIGMTNEQAGSNAGVEALINAPTIGGGRKATQARRQAAAEAVLATGGFDTSITNYQSLLAIAKQQGAVGTGSRGACKVCGQTGHLTRQCRNALPGGGEADGEPQAHALVEEPQAAPDADDLGFSSDSSDEERRRCVLRGQARARVGVPWAAAGACNRLKPRAALLPALCPTPAPLSRHAALRPILLAPLIPLPGSASARRRRRSGGGRRTARSGARRRKKRCGCKGRRLWAGGPFAAGRGVRIMLAVCFAVHGSRIYI